MCTAGRWDIVEMNRYGSIMQTSWDWRAAGNFMLGGAGSGLLFMAAIASFPDGPPRPVVFIALALVGLGLFSVWLEIGRPWRFLHVFFHPQTSWMTREAAVAVVLFLLSATGIASNIPLLLDMAGIAAIAFLFCQGQMLKACRGIPAWREPALSLLIVVTGLCEGTAVLLMFHALQHEEVSAVLELAFLVFLAARVLSWLVYRKNLIRARAPEQALTALGKIHLFQIIPGNLLPALLVLLSTGMPEWAMSVQVTASLLALLSGWHMKFTIVTRAAQVQGYSLGRIRRGRPGIKPPVRRKPDRFVF